MGGGEGGQRRVVGDIDADANGGGGGGGGGGVIVPGKLETSTDLNVRAREQLEPLMETPSSADVSLEDSAPPTTERPGDGKAANPGEMGRSFDTVGSAGSKGSREELIDIGINSPIQEVVEEDDDGAADLEFGQSPGQDDSYSIKRSQEGSISFKRRPPPLDDVTQNRVEGWGKPGEKEDGKSFFASEESGGIFSPRHGCRTSDLSERCGDGAKDAKGDASHRGGGNHLGSGAVAGNGGAASLSRHELLPAPVMDDEVDDVGNKDKGMDDKKGSGDGNMVGRAYYKESIDFKKYHPNWKRNRF